MDKQEKFKLSKGESLFVRGPLSRLKELLFSFKAQYNLVWSENSINLNGGFAKINLTHKNKMFKKTLIVLIAFTMLSFSRSTPEETYSLTIKVDGLRNSNGDVLFALYNKDGSIPDEKYEKYFKKGISKINDKGTASFTFTNLPQGSYAANVLHDENKNGKIDKKFMLPIPKEGVGFSNYESIGLSNRPNFSKASFLVKSNMEKAIKIIYM